MKRYKFTTGEKKSKKKFSAKKVKKIKAKEVEELKDSRLDKLVPLIMRGLVLIMKLKGLQKQARKMEEEVREII